MGETTKLREVTKPLQHHGSSHSTAPTPPAVPPARQQAPGSRTQPQMNGVRAELTSREEEWDTRHHPKGLQHRGAAEGKAENQSTREQSSTEHCLKFQTQIPAAGTDALGSPRPFPLRAEQSRTARNISLHCVWDHRSAIPNGFWCPKNPSHPPHILLLPKQEAF